MKRRPPTDLEILKEIYGRHREEFSGSANARTSKIMVPLDVPAIARSLGVDADSIFGRLYYHLDPKYGEPAFQGRPRKVLFTPVAGEDKNCINFPLLEAVLAGLWEERRRDLWALGTAVFSLGIALASLLISIFIR
jgi:hypothetical protein